MATTTTTTSDTLQESRGRLIPLLENGDRLTRIEYERRYELMPHLKKAELIEEVVHMPAAVRFEQHGRPHSDLIGWLGNYSAAIAGVEVGNNITIRFNQDNEPQLYALLRIVPSHGGQSRTNDDETPELIAEVAASSASYDLINSTSTGEFVARLQQEADKRAEKN